jgi:hypothetical protein
VTWSAWRKAYRQQWKTAAEERMCGVCYFNLSAAFFLWVLEEGIKL